MNVLTRWRVPITTALACCLVAAVSGQATYAPSTSSMPSDNGSALVPTVQPVDVSLLRCYRLAVQLRSIRHLLTSCVLITPSFMSPLYIDRHPNPPTSRCHQFHLPFLQFRQILPLQCHKILLPQPMRYVHVVEGCQRPNLLFECFAQYLFFFASLG